MIPTGFDGQTFKDLKVSAHTYGAGAPGPSVAPIDIERAGDAPLAVGTRVGSRTLTVNFNLSTYDSTGSGAYVTNGLDVVSQRKRLLGALQPGNGAERVLVVKDAESGGTEYQALARIGQYRFPTPTTVEVDFYLADDRWQERTDTATSQIAIPDAATGPAMPLPNGGETAAKPTLRFGWSAQRGSTSATAGWQYVRQETVSNTGTRNWRRVRLTIDLGDTAAIVAAGKALASGNDLRVRVAGDPSWAELPRTLTNWNTKRTLCHVVVSIPAGSSLTLDFVYGNPNAGAPVTLDTRTREDVTTYAADDLEGYAGTAASGGANTLTVSGTPWESNRWRYGYVQLTGGTGAGQRRKIASNSNNQITVVRNWSTQPNNTTTFVIWMTGIAVDGGIVTGAGTTSTLDDSSQAWGTNEWAGGVLYNITKGIGPFPILSNSATKIVISGTMTAPATSDSYYLERFGVLQWFVNRGVIGTSHRGLWRTNRYFGAGKVWYGDQVPAGWMPWPMLQNQDDFAQGRYVNEGSGGGHNDNYWPGLYARRSVRSDNTWPEKGQADGVAFYDPRGLLAIDFDYQLKNEGSSAVVGSAVLMSQSEAGDRWQTVASDSTAHASLANVTAGSGMAGYNRLNAEDTPLRVYLGVLPLDGVAVPSKQKKDQSIELRNHAKMLVHLDITDCGSLNAGIYQWDSEIAVYDLRATARLGGGSDAVPPYDAIEADCLLQANQELWINADPTPGRPLVGIYHSSAGVWSLVRAAPRAATITHYEADPDGTAVGMVARTVTSLRPAHNLLSDVPSTGDWTLTTVGAVSVVVGGVAGGGGYGDRDGYLAVVISSAPAGPWSVLLTSDPIEITPDTLYEFGFVAARSSLNSAIQTAIKLSWGDAGGTFNSADPDQTVTKTMTTEGALYANGGGRKVYAGPPNDGGAYAVGATTKAIVQLQVNGTDNTSGEIHFLFAGLGVPNLYVTESPSGTLTATGQWREGSYG